MLRQLTRGDDPNTPIIILEGILVFCEVEFQVEDPLWDFDSETKTWTYIEGQVTVTIKRHLEAGAAIREDSFFGEEILEEKLIADFRPHLNRPVPVPSPG